MTKSKRKKTDKKRNLKYGEVFSEKSKKAKEIPASAGMTEGEAGVAPLHQGNKRQARKGRRKENLSDAGQDREFRRELKRNVVFVGGFFLLLLVIYFVLTKTSLLNPVLSFLGLSGLYK